MRLETIRESQPTVLALTSEEALALHQVGKKLASKKQWWGEDEEGADEERSVIRCTPAGPGLWRVLVANAVGLISVGSLQIAVEPKIPMQHLLYLFWRAGELPRLDGQPARASAGAHLWQLVATWFVESCERLLRGDLRRDYEQIASDQTVVRGRVDILGAAVSIYRGRLSFPCEFEEFKVDSPINRVLRAACNAVAGSPALEWRARWRARTLLNRLDDVGALRPGDLHASLDRRTVHYADALALARHVLAAYGRVLAHGAAIATTFLIPTPHLIEKGLASVLHEGLKTMPVKKQGRSLIGSSLTFNPDLVFGRNEAIGDAKYKLTGRTWRRSDLYQVLAFATAFQVDKAAVVQFRAPGFEALPRVLAGAVTVHELAWPSDESVDATEAAAALIEAAREWLIDIRPVEVTAA